MNEIYAKAGLSTAEAQKMPEYLDWNDDFYGSSAYEKLFDYFVFDTGEMPYDTAKARNGDPDLWILDYLGDLV